MKLARVWSRDLDDACCRRSHVQLPICGVAKPHMHTCNYFAEDMQGDLYLARICRSNRVVCVYFLRNECGYELWRLATKVLVVYHLKPPPPSRTITHSFYPSTREAGVRE
jgi:hypothetical protein